MSLSIGIVGLPNAGKSTLFNALLSRQIANCAPYPFCTIEPNIGVVEVPDPRLAVLADVVKSSKIVPAIVEFKDIAGLVAGASKGEGLGNKFLANIRECQTIVHVLRAFGDPQVIREGTVDPQNDFEIVKTELCLADLQTLEKQQEVNPSVATKDDIKRWETVLKLRKMLEQGTEIRSRMVEAGAGSEKFDDDERKIINSLFLLTAKPAIFVLNIDETEIKSSGKVYTEYPRSAQDKTETEVLKKKYNLSEEVIPICAKIEMELADLNPEERKAYLKELGLMESGLERLIKKGYETLGLQTFLTAGEKEVRAWTIKKGAKAPEAAGVIHTDFEKGFIKAQVCSFSDFVKHDGWKGAAEQGKVRLEGKEYVMSEGDVVEFKFNV